MEKYNYLEAVTEDVKEWIRNELTEKYTDRDEAEQDLQDRLFIEDSVTGNASGSYTFNTWQAEENLCHNLDLLSEALQEFGSDADYMAKNGAEACDVTIRCYLLSQAISEALEDEEIKALAIESEDEDTDEDEESED